MGSSDGQTVIGTLLSDTSVFTSALLGFYAQDMMCEVKGITAKGLKEAKKTKDLLLVMVTSQMSDRLQESNLVGFY